MQSATGVREFASSGAVNGTDRFTTTELVAGSAVTTAGSVPIWGRPVVPPRRCLPADREAPSSQGRRGQGGPLDASGAPLGRPQWAQQGGRGALQPSARGTALFER